MRSKLSDRILTVVLSIIMVANMIPTSAVAEAVAEQREAATSDAPAQVASASGSQAQDNVAGSQGGAKSQDTTAIATNASNNEMESGDATESTDAPASQDKPASQDELADGSDSADPVDQPATQDLAQLVPDDSSAKQQDPAKEAAPFERTQTVDGVAVTVKAEAGTFPEDATLSVSKVTPEEQQKVEKAVDAERDDQATVVDSYTCDVKVLSADGSELQPANNHKVEVSFALPQVADNNLTTSVYHVEEQKPADKPVADELTADEPADQEPAADTAQTLDAKKLETKENDAAQTVTATSDGFSYYTVEFTYGKLQYVLAGDSSVPLATILGAVGLTGEPEAASTSNPELFSASNDTGEWVVTAHAPFDSQEWLKVTINGVEYQIDVTDDQGLTAQASATLSYLDANGNTRTGSFKEYTNQTTLQGWYAVQGHKKVNGRIRVTSGYNHLLLCDGATLECAGITIDNGSSLTIYAQSKARDMGGSSVGILKATSNEGHLASISVNEGSTLTINGGEIQALTYTDDAAGIGGDDGKSAGTITINGGDIIARSDMNAAAIGGGKKGSGGTITINGGWVEATSNDEDGAGIGGGENDTSDSTRGSGGKITINGGDVKAIAPECAAGIGGGRCGESGTIAINGGKVEATGGKFGAGIGGGEKGRSTGVTITGGEVIAIGGKSAAGIGSGDSTHANNGTTNITGGTVEATGGEFGAGIGSGDNGYSGLVKISGSTTNVTAKGGNDAAGIGGGDASRSEEIRIEGGVVDAIGSRRGSGIGGGAGKSGGTITISGTDTVVSAVGGYGAGIGSGAASLGDKNATQVQGSTVTIDGANVIAVSLGGGAGIGGGIHGSGGWITINGGKVFAQGGASYFSKDETTLYTASQMAAHYAEHANQAVQDNVSDVLGDILSVASSKYGDWIARSIVKIYFAPVNWIIGWWQDDPDTIYYTGAGIGGGYKGAGGTITISNDAYVDAQAGRCEQDSKDGGVSSAIGPGKLGPMSVTTEIYDTAKVTYGELELVEDGDNVDNVYKRREVGVTTGRDPMVGHTVMTNRYAVIEPGMFPLTIEKQWAPSALATTPSVQVTYDNTLPGDTKDRSTLTLSNVSEWKTEVATSDMSVIKLKEKPASGYEAADWQKTWELVLSETEGRTILLPVNSATGEATLNLQSQEQSGMSAQDYQAAVEAVRSGQATIRLTNTHMKTYSVQKRWNIGDANTKPASVQAVLQKKERSSQGEETWRLLGQPVELSEANEWKASFPAVPENAEYRVRELDGAGDVVEENAIATHNVQTGDTTESIGYKVNYATDDAGLTTITNELQNIVHGRKIWVDNDNADDTRPDNITIHLMANGEIVATQEVVGKKDGQTNKKGTWEWTFDSISTTDANGNTITTPLPRYDASGKKIEYTVTEDEVPSYEGVTKGYRLPDVTVAQSGSEDVQGNVDVDGYDLVNVLKEDSGIPIIIPIPIPVPTPPTPAPPVPETPTPDPPDPKDPKTDDEEKKKKNDNDDNEPDKIDIKVTKEWKDDDNKDGKRPSSVYVNLFKNGIKIKHQKMEANGEGKWELEFKDLETKLSIAGQNTSVPCIYTISEDKVEHYTTKIERDISWTSKDDLENLTKGNTNYKITNTYDPGSDGKVTYSVEKEWDIDALGQDRPNSVTAVLQKKGSDNKWTEVKRVELSAADNWKKDFEPVDKKADGKDIEYRVRELDKDDKAVLDTDDEDAKDKDGKKPDNSFAILNVGDHDTKYLVEYEEDSDSHKTTIKNTAVLDITIHKRWLMFGDAEKPDDIYLMLMSRPKAEEGGEATAYAPVYDALYGDGLDASGGVDAALGVLGLDSVMSTFSKFTGFDVNDYIKANLAMAKVDEDGDWKATFGVKKYNEAGLEQEFMGAEMVTGLMGIAAKSLTGVDFPVMIRPISPKFFTVFGKAYCIPILYEDWELSSNVINTWYSSDNDDDDPDITIGGTKIWDDNGAADRPDSVTLKVMYGDDQLTKKSGENVEVTVTGSDDDNDWVWSLGLKKSELNLDDLGVTEENFDKSKIRVEEEISEELQSKGYTATYSGLDVTNKKATNDPTRNISIEKVWNDTNNQDGIRPESVRAMLKADGEVKKVVVLSKDNNWTATAEGLPANASYTLEEETTSVITGTDGPGTYAKIITGNADDGFVITNTHTPEKINVAVHKAWNYNGQATDDRPTTLGVTLKADGEVAKQITLRASGGTDTDDVTYGTWNAIVKNLPKYKAGKEIQYGWTEEVPDGYTLTSTRVEGNLTTLTNTYNAESTSSTVRKVWEDNDNKDGTRPESAVVQLRAYHNSGENNIGYYNIVKSYRLSEDCDWEATVDDLPLKFDDNTPITYEWVEVGVPEGYEAATSTNGTITTIANIRKANVTVHKVWDDSYNLDNIRPSEVTVKLLANGAVVDGKTLTLNANNNWSGAFESLDVLSADGARIDYAVKEERVGVITGTDGEGSYEDSVSGDATSGFVITNKHTPTSGADTVTVSGSKTWNDDNNRDGKRPESITIHLMKGEGASTTEVDSKKVTASDKWSWKFEGLPKRENGADTDIVYSITEDEVKDYTSQVNGYNVTNTYESQKTSITVTKRWDDDNNRDGKRPNSIRVHLLANGTEVDAKKLTAVDEWKWTFADKPVCQAGKKINYTVYEDAVDGYTTEVDGFSITNKHTPETTTVSGSKTWDDDNNKDGKRPDSITIHLKAGGEDAGSKTVTAADDWSWNFEGLPKYSAGQEIVYTIEEELPAEAANYYTSEVREFDVTNRYTPVSVSGAKTWNDGGDTTNRPDSITVRLLANGKEVDSREIDTASADQSWTFSNLPKYELGKEIVYTITEDTIEGYTAEVNGYDVTNTPNAGKTQVTVTKVWDDDDNRDNIRPQGVNVQLLNNNTPVEGKTLELNESNKWTDAFTDLDVSGAYTVQEEMTDVITDTDDEGIYAASVAGDATKGYTITNKHTPTKNKVPISVKVIFDDNHDQDGYRSELLPVEEMAVTVNGAYEPSIEVTGDFTGEDVWEGSFDHYLPTEDRPIQYKLYPNGSSQYSMTITGDATEGFVITYVYRPPTTTWGGRKLWNDNGNQAGARPESITVRLHADGEEIQRKTVTEVDDWSWVFTNLPEKKAGKDIVYSITEDVVEGYTSERDDNNIVNTYTPGKTQVNVAKYWDDDDNRDGIRPETVTVHLLENGEDKGKALKLDAADGWTGSFTNLDVKAGDEAIDYTVVEDKIEGYNDPQITGDATSGFTVTNTHVPETMSIPVYKTWDDNDNKDNTRPTSAAVSLYANGQWVAGETLTAANFWRHIFTKDANEKDLPKYENGKEITYTVSESSQDNYSASVSGDAQNGFVVTNTYTPGKTSLAVRKVWNDSDNRDGLRPSSVTVHLLANDVDTGKTLVLRELDGWSGVFGELDQKANGVDIQYSVKEDEAGLDGYTPFVQEEFEGRGFTITNKHVAEKVQVAGTKVWDDNNDAAGLRPDYVTVRLYANGKEVDSRRVTEATEHNAWAWEFNDLPRNEAGKKLVYTVTEDSVPNYTTAYTLTEDKKITITNTCDASTIGKTQVTVHQVWADYNNQDGVRPETVTVRLYANGADTGRTVTLGIGQTPSILTTNAVAADDVMWYDAFQGLDVTDGQGKDIVYSVHEDDEPDLYTTYYYGYAKRGFTIVGEHEPDTVNVHGTKVWNDEDNLDGTRPQSIAVQLLANGELAQITEATVFSNWKWEFADLPKKVDGKDVTYSVKEVPVRGYDSNIAAPSANNDGYTITNTHVPYSKSIAVTKVWDDNENQDGLRPDHITINVLANGNKIDKADVTEGQDGKWTCAFNNLPADDAGREITYEITEEPVDGYTATIEAEGNDFIVTNKHTPEPGPDKVQHAITYQLNGGVYNGSTDDIVEMHDEGEVITIHEAPTRKGYTFTYWKGSEYLPGDAYTVTEDHTFVAQWKENGGTTPNETPGTPSGSDPSDKSTTSSTTGGTTSGGSTTRTATAKTGDASISPLIALVFFALGLAVLAIARRKRS